MTTTQVNGLRIGFDLVGDGEQTWVITPGGRFGRRSDGIQQLVDGMAAAGCRVLVWDRPNCGESDVCFDGPTESDLNTDTLLGLLDQLDIGRVVFAGGTSGVRVSILAALQAPERAAGVALWLITGGVTGLFTAGHALYCPSARAAWAGGMEAVVALPEWAETLEMNPANRERLLSYDARSFIADIERWLMAFAPREGLVIPGIPNETVSRLAAPAIVFNSGADDAIHARQASEDVAALLPGATLAELPWNAAPVPSGHHPGYFERWPQMVRPLLDWAGGAVAW